MHISDLYNYPLGQHGLGIMQLGKRNRPLAITNDNVRRFRLGR